MKKIYFFSFSLCFCFNILYPQQGVPEITIKISEKSGFLLMGKPRFAKISLSTLNQDHDLNSDNVHAGPLFYFILKDSGGWKIDEDFIVEDLPKLTITQNGVSFSLEPVSPAVEQGEHYVLHISCKKELLLHLPFNFTIPLGKKIESVPMQVSQELWPGYKKFSRLVQESESALLAGKYQESLAAYEQLLSDKSLVIFPPFDGMYTKRYETYQKQLNSDAKDFQESIKNSSIMTKQKIVLAEQYLTKFYFVSENVARDQYQNNRTKDNSTALMESAKSMIVRTTFVRDSLGQALDDQTIRWIILGSSAGKIDFKYKYMVETLAYAYLSLNFADTTASSLITAVPEDLTARLQKYSLLNSYETFLRVVNKRWVEKKPMFPPGFLQNLVKDSAQFPLPFYSMLKSVESFYSKNYESAKAEINLVMRKSYTHELTEHIDQLRILINTIEKNIPMEVLQRIKDGRNAEERGETDKAIEQYKDAILMAEDYAPAAFALGKLYDRNGDSYTANNFFQKAVTADSQYYTAYRFLYINFFKNANFKPMIDLLTQALERGNDFFDIHFYLGIAYNGSAQYDLAIQQYERALELNGKSIDANIQAGISYQNMKSYSKAREFFKRAISLDPENQTATDNLKRLDELQKKM